MYIYASHACLLSLEFRKWHRVPGAEIMDRMVTNHVFAGFQQLKLGPLLEPHMLLAAVLSLPTEPLSPPSLCGSQMCRLRPPFLCIMGTRVRTLMLVCGVLTDWALSPGPCLPLTCLSIMSTMEWLSTESGVHSDSCWGLRTLVLARSFLTFLMHWTGVNSAKPQTSLTTYTALSFFIPCLILCGFWILLKKKIMS